MHIYVPKSVRGERRPVTQQTSTPNRHVLLALVSQQLFVWTLLLLLLVAACTVAISVGINQLRLTKLKSDQDRLALNRALAFNTELKALHGAAEKRALAANAHAEDLRQLYIRDVAEMRDIVFSDGRLASSLQRRLIEFAKQHNLTSLKALDRFRPSPSTVSLPKNAVFSVLSHSLSSKGGVIEVSILNSKGEFFAGLDRTQLEVRDSARRLHSVALTQHGINTTEQSILLLIDQSGSTNGQPNLAMKVATVQFVEAVANPARIRVISFNDEVNSLSPWSIDAALHRSVIETIKPEGGTALYKAIRLAAEELSKRTTPRSIVLFADGADSFNQDSVQGVVEACRAHQVQVHVVALKSEDLNEATLRQLAADSGGMYLPVEDPSEIGRQFVRLTQELQRQVYRVHIYEPFNGNSLSLQFGELAPQSVLISE